MKNNSEPVIFYSKKCLQNAVNMLNCSLKLFKMSQKPKKILDGWSEDDEQAENSAGPGITRCEPPLPEHVLGALYEFLGSTDEEYFVLDQDSETHAFHAKYSGGREIIVSGGRSGSEITCIFSSLPTFVDPHMFTHLIERHISKIHQLITLGYRQDSQIGHDRAIDGKIVMRKPVKTTNQGLVLAEVNHIAEILGLFRKIKRRAKSRTGFRDGNPSMMRPPKGKRHSKKRHR